MFIYLCAKIFKPIQPSHCELSGNPTLSCCRLICYSAAAFNIFWETFFENILFRIRCKIILVIAWVFYAWKVPPNPFRTMQCLWDIKVNNFCYFYSSAARNPCLWSFVRERKSRHTKSIHIKSLIILHMQFFLGKKLLFCWFQCLKSPVCIWSLLSHQTCWVLQLGWPGAREWKDLNTEVHNYMPEKRGHIAQLDTAATFHVILCVEQFKSWRTITPATFVLLRVVKSSLNL